MRPISPLGRKTRSASSSGEEKDAYVGADMVLRMYRRRERAIAEDSGNVGNTDVGNTDTWRRRTGGFRSDRG
jgi:hypothetical protein